MALVRIACRKRVTRVKDHFSKVRRRRYAIAALCTNAVVWTLVLGVLAVFPGRYVSEWSLIIPVSDMDAHVNLADIGQAYATARSAYDSRSLDPRVNYKTVLLSDAVIATVARKLNVPESEVAEPQVKLVEQSSVMALRSTGRTPLESQRQAQAFMEAFQERLVELRADEAAQRDKGVEAAIRTSRAKLEAAQGALVEFKVSTRIVSSKQLEDALSRITMLQHKRLDLRSQIARLSQHVARLSASLGLAPENAGLAIGLQADALFLQLFQQYATATAELTEHLAKWDRAHPRVQSAERRQQAALEALVDRVREVSGRKLSAKGMRSLSVTLGERAQEPLMRELVANHVQTVALQAELGEVDRQYEALRQELDQLAKEYSVLDDLERRLKFSEAVFNTALGQIDVGRSNIFSSYPLVQMLAPPTLPEHRGRRNLLFALAGGAFGSLFLSMGLTLAWLRRKGE